MQHFDLAVIGSGSGNVAIPEHADGRKTALIEMGSFGGTCVNRGCIPSKMLVHTASVARNIRKSTQFGITATIESIDWMAIRDRIRARITETSEVGYEGRVESADVSVFRGPARFAGPYEIAIDDEVHIGADQIVLATGSRPSVPEIVVQSGITFYTSDTIMWIDELPSSMVILGGGHVAAEFAHVFSSLGVAIQIVTVGETLLEALDADISRSFTAQVAERWGVHLNSSVARMRAHLGGIAVDLVDGTQVTGDLLLVATGRQPNTEELDLDIAGVALDDEGRIVVDEFGRAAPGVWALGDVSSPFGLKHVANAEARTIAHNLFHADSLRPLPHDWVPSAVFSDPQVASVGARSQDLEGREYVEATQEYSETAYGWALQDSDSFCRLYADAVTGVLLGAHILGPQASLLITPLIQAMAHGQRVADLARGQYWIHPALSEVVENALLKLPLEQRVLSGQQH
jgi:mycothione reductase